MNWSKSYTSLLFQKLEARNLPTPPLVAASPKCKVKFSEGVIFKAECTPVSAMTFNKRHKDRLLDMGLEGASGCPDLNTLLMEVSLASPEKGTPSLRRQATASLATSVGKVSLCWAELSLPELISFPRVPLSWTD